MSDDDDTKTGDGDATVPPTTEPADEHEAREQVRAIDEAMDEVDPDDPLETLIDVNLLRAAPGLARIAASAWWRGAGWALGTSWRASTRVVRSAAAGETPAELFQATGAELREYARRVLEVVEAAESGLLDREEDDPPTRTEDGTEPAGSVADGGSAAPDSASMRSLRERGAELLRRSADVRFAEDAHPAYERILGELAPDEGRILRLLALEGPQPAVDVRSGWLPQVASQLVAPGLSMIGSEAGCRHKDRVPAYLNNLNRLGLIWFSREPVKDRLRYQVVEAQPEVIEAMNDGGRRTIRRSIQLTPFGDDFCETCLPLHTAELDALPGPGEDATASPNGRGEEGASTQQVGRPKPAPDA